jgi:hypothetical protein
MVKKLVGWLSLCQLSIAFIMYFQPPRPSALIEVSQFAKSINSDKRALLFRWEKIKIFRSDLFGAVHFILEPILKPFLCSSLKYHLTGCVFLGLGSGGFF